MHYEKYPLSDSNFQTDNSLTTHMLEQKYALENQLIQAVSSGKLRKAEHLFNDLSFEEFEQYSEDAIRNMKNYSIALNTILRKATENASVHPLLINDISTQYALKIELIKSKSDFMTLIKEMIRKYTLLVRNHSLRDYSIHIRKAITAINHNLTEDLSLKSLAKSLSINPSYLSALFKRETGQTLTEYVTQKRIEHAILLLNSTDMQIQNIALYCGIPDVNYFTKVFKKLVGKTPKEYREMITGK